MISGGGTNRIELYEKLEDNSKLFVVRVVKSRESNKHSALTVARLRLNSLRC